MGGGVRVYRASISETTHLQNVLEEIFVSSLQASTLSLKDGMIILRWPLKAFEKFVSKSLFRANTGK